MSLFLCVSITSHSQILMTSSSSGLISTTQKELMKKTHPGPSFTCYTLSIWGSLYLEASLMVAKQYTALWLQQKKAVRSLFFFFWLGSFSRTVGFGFPLNFWPVDYQRSAKNGFHIMECALHPIRYWLVSTINFVPLLHSCILHEVSILDGNICCCMYCCLPFYFGSMQSTL